MAARPRPIDVKALREKIGMSQRDLAARVWPGEYRDHYKRTIRRWENDGHAPRPDARKQLDRLLAEHEGKPAAADGPVRKRSTHTPGADAVADS